MAPLSNHVALTIRQDTVGVQRAGFGTGLYVSYTAAWAERQRSYASLAEVAADFPSTTGPEQLVATAYFSQDVSPTVLKIGRGALKPTLAYTMLITGQAPALLTAYKFTVKGDGVTTTDITVTARDNFIVPTGAVNATNDTFTSTAHGMTTGDGPYRLLPTTTLPAGLTVDTNYWIIVVDVDTYKFSTTKANALAGTAINITDVGVGNHVVLRAANDVMVAQIVDRLNLVVGKNFSAAQVSAGGDTDTWTITATSAGAWFSVKVDFNLITSYISHADPGVATDLTAIDVENADWYCLLTSFNSNAMVIAADAWVAARTKIYPVTTSNTAAANATLAGAGQDTMDNLKTLSRARTMVSFHPSPADMMSAAWAGRVLPIDPGSETWKFKNLTGVSPVVLTSTQRANIRAKNGNSYETVSGLDMTFEGTTSDGDFLDIQRGLDWLQDDMSKRVFEALAANDKIPYTNAGVAIIEGQVRASLKEAIAREIISDDPKPVVTAPRVADVSSADKAARNLPNVKFSATLSGAIHKVTISGVVSL